jgi:hypothetical protein
MQYAGCGWKGVCAEDILLQNKNYSRVVDNLIEEAVIAVRDGVRRSLFDVNLDRDGAAGGVVRHPTPNHDLKSGVAIFVAQASLIVQLLVGCC